MGYRNGAGLAFLEGEKHEHPHIKSESCGNYKEAVNNSALPDDSGMENSELKTQETSRITENFYRKDKIIISLQEPKGSSMHGKG